MGFIFLGWGCFECAGINKPELNPLLSLNSSWTTIPTDQPGKFLVLLRNRPTAKFTLTLTINNDHVKCGATQTIIQCLFLLLQRVFCLLSFLLTSIIVCLVNWIFVSKPLVWDTSGQMYKAKEVRDGGLSPPVPLLSDSPSPLNQLCASVCNWVLTCPEDQLIRQSLAYWRIFIEEKSIQ